MPNVKASFVMIKLRINNSDLMISQFSVLSARFLTFSKTINCTSGCASKMSIIL